MSNPSDERAPNQPFWRDGLRFECQGTGKCCTARGEYGYVYFTLEERRRAAALLGMRTSAFTRRYCVSDEDGTYLKNPKQDCLFLEDRRCTIYEARPAQCRTWPFWPENMDPEVWNRDVAGFCEGVGKGPLRTAEEIRALLEVHTRRHD
jgi:Fe-S-cluster containining protein